ncbi:MAG: DUF4093 domain-containing protein [Clostridiales bacterium]|nr:DUF4093 domain-containing protein [Clostridiales bacterium]
MIRLKEAVIVEGKYDKIKLAGVIDGLILVTDGFGIFKDKKKMALIRRLAATCGVVILTDSDAAGFRIRSYLNGCLREGKVYQAYIPDILGKERRKEKASSEGKLGVEGVPAPVILEALERAGVTPAAVDERNRESGWPHSGAGIPDAGRQVCGQRAVDRQIGVQRAVDQLVCGQQACGKQTADQRRRTGVQQACGRQTVDRPACDGPADRGPIVDGSAAGRRITKQDFYEDGLTGGTGSKNRRLRLMKRLDLPERLSANALADVLSQILSYAEYKALVAGLDEEA